MTTVKNKAVVDIRSNISLVRQMDGEYMILLFVAKDVLSVRFYEVA